MGMGNREQNFQRYIERHFGLRLPAGVALFYAQGVRVGNTELIRSGIRGELGYAACDFGFNPTNAFVQNFGHLAKKNAVNLNESEAKEFAAGKNVRIDLGKAAKYVILRYQSHTLGLGYYNAAQKRIQNKMHPKRARQIANEI